MTRCQVSENTRGQTRLCSDTRPKIRRGKIEPKTGAADLFLSDGTSLCLHHALPLGRCVLRVLSTPCLYSWLEPLGDTNSNKTINFQTRLLAPLFLPYNLMHL